MHFSKTYAELLLSLPPAMRANAIEYRKLKKLINQVVSELTQLGACFVFPYITFMAMTTDMWTIDNRAVSGRAASGTARTRHADQGVLHCLASRGYIPRLCYSSHSL